MVTRALQDLPRYRLSTDVNDELPSKCYTAVIHFTIFKLYWFNIVKLKATLGNEAKKKKKEKKQKQKQSLRGSGRKEGHKISTKLFRRHSGTCRSTYGCVRGESPKVVPTRLMAFNKTDKSNKPTRERRKKNEIKHTHLSLWAEHWYERTPQPNEFGFWIWNLTKDRKQGHLMQQLQIRTKVESPCDHLQRGGSVTLQR